jgi:hypothetical protein
VASSGKRKTTMAKMNRERKLLERRQEKQARKDARRASPHDPGPLPDTLTPNDGHEQEPHPNGVLEHARDTHADS